MLSCILLSAGSSKRFGSPKALAQLSTGNVIEYVQRNLIKTSINEIIVVLGAHAEKIEPFLLDHKNVRFVYNKDHNFGQTSSFKVGLQQVTNNSTGFFLLPVDSPFVSTMTLESLISLFNAKKPKILIPSYMGKKGHPPLFCARLKSEFLALDNGVGINTVAHKYQEETIIFSVEDSGVTATFNTPEEFERVKKEFI